MDLRIRNIREKSERKGMEKKGAPLWISGCLQHGSKCLFVFQLAQRGREKTKFHGRKASPLCILHASDGGNVFPLENIRSKLRAGRIKPPNKKPTWNSGEKKRLKRPPRCPRCFAFYEQRNRATRSRVKSYSRVVTKLLIKWGRRENGNYSLISASREFRRGSWLLESR